MGKKAVLMQQGREKNAAQNRVMQPAKEKKSRAMQRGRKKHRTCSQRKKKMPCSQQR
jgi:hypothetical protein